MSETRGDVTDGGLCPDCRHRPGAHHHECTANLCGCDRSADEFSALGTAETPLCSTCNDTGIQPDHGPTPDCVPCEDCAETPRGDERDALKVAVERGLRACRVEDAPNPLIREGDLLHTTHMVTDAVLLAGFTRAPQDDRAAQRGR